MSLKKTGGLRAVLISTGAIALLFLPFLLIAGRAKLGADGAFNEFARALEKHDFSKAYALTDSDFQSVTPFPQFVQQHEDLEKEFGKLIKVEHVHGGVEFSASTDFSWQSNIIGKLELSTREVELIYTLRKQDSRWLIRGYSRIR